MEQLLTMIRRMMDSAGMAFPMLRPGNLPKPVMYILMYLAIAVGVLGVLRTSSLSQTVKTFIIVGLIVLAVTITLFFLWKRFKQSKQNKQFGGDISQHSSATPRGLSDPGQRARLDDMRKKFQSGVEAYKSRGKDLYKLPWYAIVGEPGSGKTEAVRHSNVGFPPGMQDEFQGVGGTINMNWWFTNQAVLLDTAGRLMFEEVKPGETSEWKEFLTLLKKNRPNCPINGLLLVIPSDSLIKDSADAIQKKAGKIAQQLDVIQRVLDVRFPVFVVITKCDKMNGFREFFDSVTDPQLQHQMVGWSNPDPLDEPFKPEQVDKYLEQVAARLRRRRLGLLRDPIPENTDGRRTDEVDSLYALPHSLEMLSSRLRRYLETIFIAGEWSAKPLFLRGIYLSSSMREGGALDAELAEAMGLGVEELPEGKVWERERAYFLRDLFLEKAFREKGLVTRATNTRTMMRGQRVALYGLGFLSLVVFSAAVWFAVGNLRSAVKDQSDFWRVVSATGWERDLWKQSIVPLRGDGSFASGLSTNAVMVDNKPVTLGEFHSRLRELAEKPLKKNFLFPGLADKYNRNSRNAQRIVFEAGVVRPLIDATRQKMQQGDADAESARRQPDALAALIQLESDILARGQGNNKGELSPAAAQKFLTALGSYVAGADVTIDTNLVSVMSWTYTLNESAKGSWVPRWFSGGRSGTNTLAANTGINAGLEQFVRQATNGIQAHLADWNEISALRGAVKTFADTEGALFAAAAGGVEAKFLEAQRALDTARKNLEDQVAKSASQKLFEGGVSLTNAQQKFRAGITGSAGAALERVRAVNNDALAANRDYPLFKDIGARLDAVQVALSNRVAELLKSGDAKEFETLDETYLSGNAFSARADLYTRAEKTATESAFTSGRLIGQKGEQLDTFFKERMGAVRNDANGYGGKLKDKAVLAVGYHLKLAEKKQSDSYFQSYLAEVKTRLLQDGGFPLVRDLSRVTTPDKFGTVGKQLKYVSDDLASPAFQKLAPRDQAEWKSFFAGVESQQLVAKALLGDEGILGACRVSLAASADPPTAGDLWREQWRDIRLVVEGAPAETVRAAATTDQKLGECPVQLKLELRFIKNANENNSPSQAFVSEAWGPLALIHKHNGTRDKVDPRTWLVEFPVPVPDLKGTVRLKLQFDRPLPELDKWAAK